MAARHGCDAILQVGDFGYDPAHIEGRRFLRRCDVALEAFGLWMFWVDGNHDNHAALGTESLDADGMGITARRIRHLPRGYRWAWTGVRFGALGGAFSPDWRSREENDSWWPQEVLTDADVASLGDGPLDVLVTHDAPERVTLQSSFTLEPADELRSEENRQRVGRALEATRPRLLVHGHWHHRYSTDLSWIDAAATEADDALVWASTRVEGLGADVDEDSGAWAVLELPSLAIAPC